jgi:hypothetical protein
MSGILSDLCDFDDAISKFNTVMNNTVFQLQTTGFEILSRVNEIIADNGEGFINNTKHAALDALFQVEDKTKQDVIDVIEQFTYNLTNSVDSIIEHAKNVTMDVLDQGLEKMRYETNIFVEDIITNRFLIILGVFILIILFSATVYLFRHLSKDTHWCSKLFEILSNMLLIVIVLLTFVWFGLALVSFFQRAIDDKDPFYIIGTIILLFAILYGICHLCCFFKTEIPKGWERLRQKISKHEDSIPPAFSQISSKH